MGLTDLSVLFCIFIVCIIYFSIKFLQNRKSDGSEVEILENKEESRQVVSTSPIEEQGDVVDYPDYSRNRTIKTALDNVSEAIYSSYIAVWLKAPGEIKSQPLYEPINNAVVDVYDNVQKKTGHIDSCKIVLVITNALIKHLKSFRKDKTRTTKIRNREDEVTILREQSKSLLTCLLPDSLRNSVYLMPFLTETVAVSVLETTINYLAHPSFINQLVVTHLDNHLESAQAHSTPSAKMTQNEDCDLETDSRMYSPAAPTCRLRKQHGRAAESSEGSSFRSLVVTKEDSNESDTTDSSSEDIDSSDLQMSLYDSCCEQWADKDWTATSLKMEDNSFRITIKITNDGLDPVSWDTQRSMQDFAELCDRLSERSAEDEASRTNKRNENPELLIPMLVKKVKEKDKECTFFLSPFPYNEEFRRLFVERDFEDESSNESSSDSGSLCCDGQIQFKALAVRSTRKKDKKETQPAKSVENEGNPPPERSASDDNQSQAMLDYMRSNHPMNTSNDVVPHSIDLTKREKQEKEKKEARKALLDLVKEVFRGIEHVLTFANVVSSRVRNYLEGVLSLAEQWFSEEQIVCYLQYLSDLIRAPEAAPLPPLEPLRTKAAKVIAQRLKSLLKSHIVFKIFKNSMMSDAEKIHSRFQNIGDNKEVLLELLKDLVKMIIDEAK